MKKGFTLVELLAVVVILALILAIAVPAITNITTTAKKNMFENSSKMILKSMKNDYDGKIASNGSFTDTFILYDNSVRTVYPSSNNLDFTISATDGGIVRHWDGTVTFALYDGTNCSIKTRTSNDITVIVTDKATCVSNIIYKQAAAPFTNLVTNGDFTNGTTGWSIGNGYGKSSVISASNGIFNITGTTTNSVSAVQIITATSLGHLLYGSARFRSTNSLTSEIVIDLTSNRFASVSLPIQNLWYTRSGIITSTSNNILVFPYINYPSVAAANGSTTEIDYIIAIDLTAIYGSGNEPTATQMDNNINKVWIDTATANTPKRFTGGGWINF